MTAALAADPKLLAQAELLLLRDLTMLQYEQRIELDRMYYKNAIESAELVECIRCGVTSPGTQWVFGCPFCHRSTLDES